MEIHETSSFCVKNKNSASRFFLESPRKIPLQSFLFPGEMFSKVKYFFKKLKKK